MQTRRRCHGLGGDATVCLGVWSVELGASGSGGWRAERRLGGWEADESENGSGAAGDEGDRGSVGFAGGADGAADNRQRTRRMTDFEGLEDLTVLAHLKTELIEAVVARDDDEGDVGLLARATGNADWGAFHVVGTEEDPSAEAHINGWWCAGGLAPEGSATAAIQYASGELVEVRVQEGAWVLCLPVDDTPRSVIALCRAVDGTIVPFLEPETVLSREPCPDQLRACPACERTDWELIHFRDSFDEGELVRCTCCGFCAPVPRESKPSRSLDFSTAAIKSQRRAAISSPAVRPVALIDSAHLGQPMLGYGGPLPPAPPTGIHLSYRPARFRSDLTPDPNYRPSGAEPVLTISTHAGTFPDPLEIVVRQELANVLRIGRKASPTEGLGLALEWAADRREVEQEASRATSSTFGFELDGEPLELLARQIGDSWAAVAQLDDADDQVRTLIISGKNWSMEPLRLASLDDLTAIIPNPPA